MDLSRREYPAMLEALSPGQAVTVLNERIKQVGRLNTDIADWLQERRRVEEAYVKGLRQLARRQPPDESSGLGIFNSPWSKIVSSTEELAHSHHTLAQKIEADVERPLRDFDKNNREMQSMATISGNLAAMAKEVDAAQRNSDKLKAKGSKASAGKVATASSDIESAQSQWESQAPYVFENLQAVDESRLNHLRDVLTQFQTHEVDQVERNRVAAEQTLNTLLTVETADEIKSFQLRTLNNRPAIERQTSRTPAAPPTSQPTQSSLAPTPSHNNEDDASQRSSSFQEQKTGGLHGLKRLGTVLGRRRQSYHPYGRGQSPEKAERSTSNLGSKLPFGGRRDKNKDRDLPSTPEAPPPPSSSRRLSDGRSQVASRMSEAPPSPTQFRGNAERTNGMLSPPAEETEPSSSLTNGSKQSASPELQEPLRPEAATLASLEPPKDAEGFSVPQSGSDAIAQAEREAAEAGTSEQPQPQFKLDIRDAPIREEGVDDEAALASVANSLKMQAAMPRRSGTARGRRDVRNTIFVPSPQTPDLSQAQESPKPTNISASGPLAPTIPESEEMASPPSLDPIPPSSPPLKTMPHRAATLGLDDHAASDTQSIRSGRSLSSAASATIKHPDLHGPGLNSSIVETVSAWYEHGSLTKAVMIGEAALAFNPESLSAPFGTETIRLENFPVLEKVAPNPVFIDQIPDKAGFYTVNLSSITKTTVAFKYQIHLDDSNLTHFAPLQITPAWKVEAAHTSLLLHYSLNPAFDLHGKSSLSLTNVVLVGHLEGSVRASSCQSKPVGSFSREKNLVYWRLGDVTLSPGQPAQILRARFFTDSEATPGNIEARWDILGDNASSLGSGLAVSKLDQHAESATEADPFADEETEKAEQSSSLKEVWHELKGVKKITSGTYTAI